MSLWSSSHIRAHFGKERNMETIDTCPSCHKPNRSWDYRSEELQRECEHCGTIYPFKFVSMFVENLTGAVVRAEQKVLQEQK